MGCYIITLHIAFGQTNEVGYSSSLLLLWTLGVNYASSVNFTVFLIVTWWAALVVNVSLKTMIRHKVMKLQSVKSGQVLCAHNPYFLMPDHK